MAMDTKTEILYGGIGYGYGMGYPIQITEEVINSENSIKETLNDVDKALTTYRNLIIKKLDNRHELNQTEVMFLMSQKFTLANTLADIDYAKKQKSREVK